MDYLCVMKKTIAIFVAALMLLPVACSVNNNREEQDMRPTVTVSLPPQAWILKAIAGDSVKINILFNKGSNPETYEPTISTIRDAAGSDLLLLSGGLTFESVIVDRITENNSRLKIADTSRGIDPILNTHSHSHGDHEHEVSSPDPHTWTSVVNTRTIATNMLDALKAADPSHAEYYSVRAAQLDRHLDSLDQAIRAKLDPIKTRAFLVWHPSLSYFARDYGLNQIVLGNEGREPSVKHTRDVIDNTTGEGAHVLFIQSDYDSSRAKTLARETGARVVEINPLDSDWEKQINIITDALTKQ